MQKGHVYAFNNSPMSQYLDAQPFTQKNFYDLPEPFPKLTLEQKRKLVSGIEFSNCTNIASKYEMVCKLGQGTFGEVYKAREKGTVNFVALKKVPPNAEYGGFPLTAMREIRILQQLQHDNIVRFLEVCTAKITGGEYSPGIFYIVLEYCDHNLEALLSEKCVKLTLGMRKTIMKQLLNGLYFMHSSNILHRDIKAANILITRTGTLKIADFGLARSIGRKHTENKKLYSNRVVTLWYRAPELLLGDRCYTAAIDMWSTGCLMAELWTHSPIMTGSSEQEQLIQILQLCGSISKNSWPNVEQLPLFSLIELPTHHKRRLKERLGKFVNEKYALDLVDKFLTLNPLRRINADKALIHEFFWEEPLPESLQPFLNKYRDLKMQPRIPLPQEQYKGYVEQIF